MNKLFTKIAAACVGIAMAVGVGVAVGSNSTRQAKAAITWTRVTSVDTLLSGGTFIIGYESTENSGVIVPMANSGSATTSAAGYMYSGSTASDGGTGTINMSTVNSTTNYEVEIGESSEVAGAIYIKLGANYLGNTNTKNNCKLFTEESETTSFSVSFGANDNVTLDIEANDSGKAYRYFKYNNTNPRFAVYSTAPEKIVIYQKIGTNDNPTVSISSGTTSFLVGGTRTFPATTENDGGNQVVWSLSGDSVGTIGSSTGVFNATAVGTATVTATLTVNATDYTDSVTIKVLYTEPAHVTGMSLAQMLADARSDKAVAYEIQGVIKGWGTTGTDDAAGQYGNMLITDGVTDVPVYGATANSSRLVFNGETNQYVYTSINSFLTTNATKNLKIGDRLNITCIRTEHNSNKQINAIITSSVVNELDSIVVIGLKNEYNQGDSVENADFSVTAIYTVAGEVEVDSADCTVSPAVLTVAGNSIEVTVSYGGKSDTFNVKVNENEIPITSSTLTPATATIHANEKLQMVFSPTPANHTETIAWFSSDDEIATVSDSGLVTPVTTGVVTITVLTDSQEKTSTITIIAANPTYNVTDTLNREFTGVPDSTGSSAVYTDWSAKQSLSNAIYAGNSAGDKNSLQLRSNNETSGFISTTSGGLISKVEATWKSDTAASRVLNVYGSHSAYSGIGDLYDEEKQGTLLGTLTYSGSKATLNIAEPEYEYIGIRSNSGAHYVDEINITWLGRVADSEITAANSYATAFLSAFRADGVCDENGVETNKSNVASVWASQKGTYEALAAGARAYLKLATADKDSEETIEVMAYVYEHIFTLYGTELSLNNFIGRTPAAGRNSVIQANNNNTPVVVIVVSSISLISVAGFIMLKKRKEQ